MGFISTLLGVFSAGGSKLMAYAIGALVAIGLLAGGYFYIHGKNNALAKAQSALALAQTDLAAAVAANASNIQTINALRAQAQQQAMAETAMNLRDQVAQNAAANIQSLIDSDATGCPAITTTPAAATAKDDVVAPVLKDALSALANAQGAAP